MAVALTEIVADMPRADFQGSGTHLCIMLKDVALSVAQARSLGVSVPVLETARAVWTAAAEEYAAEDFTSIVRYVEQQATHKSPVYSPGQSILMTSRSEL